jgi:hypothetical protein
MWKSYKKINCTPSLHNLVLILLIIHYFDDMFRRFSTPSSGHIYYPFVGYTIAMFVLEIMYWTIKG